MEIQIYKIQLHHPNLKFEIHWYHLLIFYVKTNIFHPGPSQLYPTVPQHLQNAIREHIGSISHRGIKTIFQEMKEFLLTYLISPQITKYLSMSSAIEIWERIIQNLIINSSHHFINGSFSQRFYNHSCL